jgi:hypothetical protein
MKIHLYIVLVIVSCATCWGSSAEPEIILPSRAGDYLIKTDPTATPPDPNYYGIGVFDSNTGIQISKLPGFFTGDDGTDGMLSWQPNGTVLAVNVPDNRRVSHIELFYITSKKALSLKIPDYFSEIAKRINSASLSDYSGYTAITGWHGDLFFFEFNFRVYEPDTKKYRGFYSCSVALHIDPKSHSVSIDSITDPIAE